MRRRHGCAAKADVGIVGGVIAGTSVRARGGDIGLYPVAPIDYHRAAATKGRDVVGAGVQGTNCVRRRINGRRIFHSGTVRT